MRARDPARRGSTAVRGAATLTLCLAALAALAARGAAQAAGPLGGTPAGAPSADDADSAARAVIAAELRAFYRDLDARQWTPLMTHFWPAKLGARWEAPAWEWPSQPAPSRAAGASPAVLCASGANQPQDAAQLERAVQTAGRWARVAVHRCAGAAPDEFWLLRMSGQWKIVRLALAHPR
jgi:hypothetical protein